jgi:hypothetical protein
VPVICLEAGLTRASFRGAGSRTRGHARLQVAGFEVGQGIHRPAVAPHLEVEVRAVRVAAAADLGDLFADADLVPFLHQELAGVRVQV